MRTNFINLLWEAPAAVARRDPAEACLGIPLRPTGADASRLISPGLPRRAPRGLGASLEGWVLAAAIFLLPLTALPQPSAHSDYDVIAAWLVKFTQYTVWPSNTFKSSNAPVVIGVLGSEPPLQKLEEEAKGVVGTRPVQVRRISTVEEAVRCQVVFIGEAESRNEREWFGALRGTPILTVGESDWTFEHGAVMRFVIKKNKTVRFEANLNLAKANQLGLSERMLAVASKVIKRQTADKP